MMKRKRKLIKAIIIAVFVPAVFFISFRLSGSQKGRESDRSGIPDVVSSRIHNDDCYLTVVANSGVIKNQKSFAEKIVRMYRDNAFHTTRFSTDMENIPKRLHITVYLQKDDIERGEDVFGFQYDTETDIILPE